VSDLIPFDHLNVVRLPAGEISKWAESGFVFGTFMKIRNRRGKTYPMEALAEAMKMPGTTLLIATPAGDPTLIWWLVARPAENRIVCCYVKAAYRASPDQRAGREENVDAFRVASSMALAAGIDFSRPVPCSFWSRAAAAIERKAGNPYSLRYAPEETR